MSRGRVSFVVVLVIAVTAAALVIGTGSALMRPVHVNVGAPPPDLGAEPVAFRSESGATIRGWWAAAPESDGVVLLLPGVRANRLSMLGRARFLRAAGYSVLLVDLQATGESRGDAITFGWRERLDVLAARDFIARRAPGQPVAIIGSSLGGAAAVLASPRLRADAMVLEAVYPSVERATKNRLRMRLGAAGELLAPLLLLQLEPRLGVRADQLRPIDAIRNVQCPVLIVGGAADRHTTPADTVALFLAAPRPKELWLIPGAAHVDFHRNAKAEYEARVLRFLRASL